MWAQAPSSPTTCRTTRLPSAGRARRSRKAGRRGCANSRACQNRRPEGRCVTLERHLNENITNFIHGALVMTISTPIVAGALLCLAVTPAAHAQTMVDVSKITCEQFLLYKITNPNNIAIWISGYYNGKRNNTV